jgi:hypothetical protein
MPLYLDPRGRTNYGLGICARCSCKFFLDELYPDPNAPGLRVCLADLDSIDPYRLPARAPDNLVLPFCRPDASIAIRYSGGVNVPLYTNPIFGINQINAARPWAANTLYRTGDSITPQNVDLETTTLPQNWWLCLVGGVSGATPPDWPSEAGVIIGDFIALTSDPTQYIYLLDNLGIINLQNEDSSKDLTTDVPAMSSDAVLQLLSDNGLNLYSGANGDGTVVWLNLGIYPV